MVPARGESKGIARKNLREIGGKSLIAWSVEQAKRSKYIDRLILSSEDPEIIETARNLGCEVPFIRPATLARDDTPGTLPALHALDAVPEAYHYVVLLQPTSPLRTVEHIDGCIELCHRRNAKVCVSVTDYGKNPFWFYRMDAEGIIYPFIETDMKITRRQELPKLYTLNGAVYVAEVDWFKKHVRFISIETIGYVMPPEQSIDIDTETDLIICDCLLRNRAKAEAPS